MVAIYIGTLVLSLVINLSLFTVAYLFKTDKLTDLSYGLTFVALVVGVMWYLGSFSLSQVLVVLMVCLWAIRLAVYLVVRIHKMGRDKRFDEMREKFWSFLQFWVLQGVAVWVILLPAIYLLGGMNVVSLGLWSYVGMFIWLLGLVVESVADYQKFVFKNDSKNKGKFISYGLWHYSRHPNYFGEMLVWWGIFVYAMPWLQGWGWLTVVGPVFISCLLLFVTGIPPLEKRYAKKYGDDKDYQNYVKETSLLVPLPRKG